MKMALARSSRGRASIQCLSVLSAKPPTPPRAPAAAKRAQSLAVECAAAAAPAADELEEILAPGAAAAPAAWFTGLSPAAAPGWRADARALGGLAMPRLDERGPALRAALEAYFENGWALTETLFAGLRDGAAFYRPPAHGLRHPMIFYYGHPAALAINKLRVAGLIETAVDAEFEALFETGVDEMRWDDLHTPATAWPSIAEVHAYRRAARARVLDVVRGARELDAPLEGGAAADVTRANDAVWALAMIAEHERIHIETSTTLIRELPLACVRRPAAWPRDHPSAWEGARAVAPPRFLRVTASDADETVSLGKPRATPTYGWDNEYGARDVALARGVEATATPVTNGQFLEFVKGGGYADASLWTDDGWAWRAFRNTKAPHFWVPSGPAGLHEYGLRLPFEVTPALPTSLPVEARATRDRGPRLAACLRLW